MASQIIGFIGLGTMGAGMARNLAKKGFSVIGYNRTPERAHALKEHGIEPAEKIKDLLRAQAIISCVSDDQALEEALIASGLLAELAPGTILIDSSTVSVAMEERLAQECERRHLRFLDAPVTGSQPSAEQGTLLFMVGGERPLFEQCRPIFEAMGTRFVYCGPPSFGARAKIALNMTQALMLESYLEGLVLGLKEGVELDALLEIFENSGAKCGVGTFKLPKIRSRDFSPQFKLRLMRKDLGLAEQELARLGLELPLAERIVAIFEEAMERGDEDLSTIAKTLEGKAGVELR